MPLTGQDYLVSDLPLLLLIHTDCQILAGYLVTQEYRLLVLNRGTELHIISLGLDGEERVFKVSVVLIGSKEDLVF